MRIKVYVKVHALHDDDDDDELNFYTAVGLYASYTMQQSKHGYNWPFYGSPPSAIHPLTFLIVHGTLMLPPVYQAPYLAPANLPSSKVNWWNCHCNIHIWHYIMTETGVEQGYAGILIFSLSSFYIQIDLVMDWLLLSSNCLCAKARLHQQTLKPA